MAAWIRGTRLRAVVVGAAVLLTSAAVILGLWQAQRLVALQADQLPRRDSVAAVAPDIPEAAQPEPADPAEGSDGPARATGRLAFPVVAPSWVSTVADRTGIPPRALTAYANAHLATGVTQPGCHVSWTMLAAIGAVESAHGTFGGATLRPDGTTTVAIVGPALDGTNDTAAIPASAHGRLLHGDPRWEHAVGPMQFLPSTWDRWGASPDRPAPDPNDIDDAALTAARYLCAAGGDLATGPGWQAAIGAYNAPAEYAAQVTDLANRYARQSR